MTKLLEEVVARIKQLPEEEQDFYAIQLREELEADHRWDELFDKTTAEQARAVVEKVRRDRTAGETRPLDAFLSRRAG